MIVKRSTAIDKINPITGSIIINRSIEKFNGTKDPIVEIFVSVRNKYKSEFLVSIIPASRNALGWQYNFLPANVEDGDEELAKKLQDYLENKIAPEFEDKIEHFFLDPDGYAAYKTCAASGEIEAANQVIKNYIYRVADEDERRKLDKKAEKARKAELKNIKEREKSAEFIKKLGMPTKITASLLLLL